MVRLCVGLAILWMLMACSAAPDTTTSLSAPEILLAPTQMATFTPVPMPNCGEKTAVSTTLPAPSAINNDRYTLIASYPHDSTAFTQGLEFVDGLLVEGTGLYGESSLRVVELETGAVQKQMPLEAAYFGEGITVLDGRIYQITWKAQTAFVYDENTWQLEETFTYATQGWGLTNNGRCLIMSDGSSTLYFRDPDTFAELGQLPIYDDTGPITQINELEYIDGEIYANIWKQNRIARISPETGQVLGWLALDDLVAQVGATHPDDVLNGIAYDAENGRIFITGKRWPTLFEITINP